MLGKQAIILCVFSRFFSIFRLGANKLDCTWLNATVPLFADAGVNVYTIAKIKTLGGTIYQRKVLEVGDCFDLGKIFDGILFFMNKFSKATA